MRVAALNDIHGNVHALDAVLADVERASADVVVCGGDLVGGPFSAEVYDRLAGQPDARFLHGNADRLVAEGTNAHEQDWRAERARLGETRVRSIAAWPLTVELRIETLGRVLFCHAIPTADEQLCTYLLEPPDPDETSECFEGLRGA